ncbi:NAD(P)-dependent oxidoreductase [Streptomyces sp. WAC05374]|uniref:NAD(P)-dependent oxidoreductase n=1 Tax=Streptomyces sp. WAC05374 TaxID=2487420 RepID=UPI000F872118|nr:NAD(P)-binding domain-containing protein [Streptomyces sp. WAC05374]RST09736.1 NAD(P)-dependent oxidoreductase [Streptomyces sp. WAC05374]TDF50123.1 NAD(P)-dependent oxidoreductase [Streptomyces sp. WAC05374]TDF57848.1 NAD(P)-dependent oxidoreductase [Streptomyces sp. WAC05374]TDF60377.1 NAD(P)-dependent oxidoreductase [Streptomyces sp. WAC05374]
MNETTSQTTTSSASLKTPVTLLGLGAMGTALARTWLAAGHPLTVWNRTPARAAALVDEGAKAAADVAGAVAASTLVVVCLLDDASVGEALADADLTGKDLVNLTTTTPAQARARAAWARGRGARYLDGGIMAVPPMIGVPEAGGYVFYSGSRELFELHQETLAVPAGTVHVGEDAGFAALHDVALLSAMYGMFAGVAHAFALIRKEDIDPVTFAPLLSGWISAMAGPAVQQTARQLKSGDYTTDVVSNLAMQVAGTPTFLTTAEQQGVSPELINPYFELMRRRLAEGSGEEDLTGVVDLLLR